MTLASLTKTNRGSLKLIKKGSLTSVGVSSIPPPAIIWHQSLPRDKKAL